MMSDGRAIASVGAGGFRGRDLVWRHRTTLLVERVSAFQPVVVETILDGAHHKTNVGEDLSSLFPWAGEMFEPQRPDTTRTAA